MRTPACPVVRSVVKSFIVDVPSAIASATLAIVASEGEPVRTGWNAKSAYERPVKTSRRCSTASRASNSCSVTWIAMNAKESTVVVPPKIAARVAPSGV